MDKYLLDTHIGPVKRDVWELYAQAIKLIGETNTLLEWDAEIPSFAKVVEEAHKAKHFVDEKKREPYQYASIA
jgi:uncharacterized protein (UPF0276 family)